MSCADEITAKQQQQLEIAAAEAAAAAKAAAAAADAAKKVGLADCICSRFLQHMLTTELQCSDQLSRAAWTHSY